MAKTPLKAAQVPLAMARRSQIGWRWRRVLMEMERWAGC